MNFDFTQLSDCVLAAYQAYQKTHDLVNKKQEILDEILIYYDIKPKKILFLGFSPWLMAKQSGDIYVTCVSEEVLDFLDSKNIVYNHIHEQQLSNYNKYFDVVMAADEFYTFTKDEAEQQEKIALIGGITRGVIITTLRDYKNLHIREREFSQPTAIQNNTGFSTFIEYHHYEHKVKNKWQTYISEVSPGVGAVTGPLDRRAMYFKQLAKFNYDAGATSFLVHKNLMYKGLLKKNYEHVISIRF